MLIQTLTERQQLLHDWLKSQPVVSVAEIQERFGISAPTAYRDALALVENGLAFKTRGGIRFFQQPVEPALNDSKCAYCGGELNQRISFVIQLQDGKQRTACCPHCGLLGLDQPGITAALTRDFIYGKMINARQAVFLLESTVSLCCEPSVLCFANQTDARNFQSGFGGQIYSLDEAKIRLDEIMNLK